MKNTKKNTSNKKATASKKVTTVKRGLSQTSLVREFILAHPNCNADQITAYVRKSGISEKARVTTIATSISDVAYALKSSKKGELIRKDGKFSIKMYPAKKSNKK